MNRMQQRLGFFIYLIGLVYMLFAVDRSETSLLLGLFALLAVVYFTMLKSNSTVRSVASMAIALRCAAWFAFPNLSDDIYRFIWDGSLILDGVNPYLYTPAEYISGNLQAPYEQLFPKLNSPGYYSVYPMVIQFCAAFGALAANDPYLASLLIKLPILLAELGTIWMLPQILRKMNISPRLYKVYALNPLVIIELCGNAHFEGVMIFFVVLCLRWLLSDQSELAGIALALAVSTKLIPFLLFPFLLKSISGKERRWFILTFMLSLLILFVPLLQRSFLEHFFSSIDLYFRSFEFNASIYYLLRTVGFWLVGYNTIAWLGPGLLVLAAGIVAMLWIRQEANLRNALLHAAFGLTAYYLLATTVHPWYLSLLVLFSVFLRKPYMIAWPLAAFLSYSAYGSEGFGENIWLISAEYAIVLAAMIWEKPLTRRLTSILG